MLLALTLTPFTAQAVVDPCRLGLLPYNQLFIEVEPYRGVEPHVVDGPSAGRGQYLLSGVPLHDGEDLLMRLPHGTVERIRISVLKSSMGILKWESLYLPTTLPNGTSGVISPGLRDNPNLAFSRPMFPQQNADRAIRTEFAQALGMGEDRMVHPPEFIAATNLQNPAPVARSHEAPAGLEFEDPDPRLSPADYYRLGNRALVDGEEVWVKYPGEPAVYEKVKLLLTPDGPLTEINVRRLFIPYHSPNGIRGHLLWKEGMDIQFARP